MHHHRLTEDIKFFTASKLSTQNLEGRILIADVHNTLSRGGFLLAK